MAHVLTANNSSKNNYTQRPTYAATFSAIMAVLAVARHTDDVIASRDEAAGSNRLLTDLAHEAVGVPLASAMFILLHT